MGTPVPSQRLSRRGVLVAAAIGISGCIQPQSAESEWSYDQSHLSHVDAEILDMIAARMAIADEIGAVKAREDLPVEVPEQEEVVLDRVAEKGLEAGVDPELVRAVFRDLIEMSKDVQWEHFE